MRLFVFLFAIITTASTIRCYNATGITKQEELEKLSPSKSSATFCTIRYHEGEELFDYGHSKPDFGVLQSGNFSKVLEKRLPCSKPEYKNYTSNCFNPDRNTLCCRGDYCNYMPSLDCAEVYVPKKCPVGTIVYHEKKKVAEMKEVRLKGCPADTKFCSFLMPNVKDATQAEYLCWSEYQAKLRNNKTGCGSNITENYCYMPIDERFSLNWGVEMFSEWSSAQQKLLHEATSTEASSDATVIHTDPTGQSDKKVASRLRKYHQPMYVHTAFFLVLMVIF